MMDYRNCVTKDMDYIENNLKYGSKGVSVHMIKIEKYKKNWNQYALMGHKCNF